MTRQFSNFKMSAALALFTISLSAHADVVRCADDQGQISYTNESCAETTRIEEVIMTEKSADRNFVYQTPVEKRPQQRSSVWAKTYIAPRKRQPDVESMRNARLKAMAMERTPRSRLNLAQN